jgi:hypothetical protein
MSVQILSLAHSTLADTAQHALYTTPAGLTSIVKSIRLVNAATGPVTINLYFTPSGGSSYFIAPTNLLIGAGGMAIDDQEITMGPGDSIQAAASVGGAISYVISGIQR